LPENQKTYLAELRYHGMAGAAIEDFGQEFVEPIEDIIVRNKFEIKEIDNFLLARHAREANAQLERINPDREKNEALSGMTNEQADRILTEYRNNTDMQEIGRIADLIGNFSRDLLVESGLETAETVQKWRDTYQHYVPLMREGFGSRMLKRGAGSTCAGSPSPGPGPSAKSKTCWST
jgi:hypothetical protein